MENLPSEVIRLVYNYLSPVDRLNCLFVCRRFLAAAIIKDLPSSELLRFRLRSCPSQGHISNQEACISICDCGRHGASEVLQLFLPHLIDDVHSLEVDDELAKTQISDKSLFILLAGCVDAPLNRLSLYNCDLARVKPWTLALLAKFNKLKELFLDSCILPLSETQLIRSIAPSFQTLVTVEIKDSSLITDKFAHWISKYCPNLYNYSVTGCREVTAASVMAFVETAKLRSKPVMNMKVERTSFDEDQLVRYLKSPLFPERDDWGIRISHMPLTNYSVIIVDNIDQICVIIRV